MRTVINDIYWEDCSRSVRLKNGAVADDSVLLLIPMARNITPRQDNYIVRGAVDFEVTGAEGQTLPELLRLHDVKAVISVDTMNMGSTSMWHWEVGLK